jgi:small subunit ribosomal protein S14
MAKKSSILKNQRRARLVKKYAGKRARLKEIADDPKRPPEERFMARLKMAELPRNSSPNRVKNRCEVTGRPRSYYRKFRMSRIALRQFAGAGRIPGIIKSSW